MTNTVGFSSCKTRCFMHIFTETVNQIKVATCMIQGMNYM